jgi:hypothetical protein
VTDAGLAILTRLPNVLEVRLSGTPHVSETHLLHFVLAAIPAEQSFGSVLEDA